MVYLAQKLFLVVGLLAMARGCTDPAALQPNERVLKGEKLDQYVTYFNQMEPEDVVNYVPNAQSASWMKQNVPLFECPDSVLEKNYYYRWWTFRKHLKETPDGFVFTEFITPVSHDGMHNTISCALSHHVYEGRWLHNQEYLNQYVNFWFETEKKSERSKYYKFSSWIGDAAYNRFLVNQDSAHVLALLDDFIEDYKTWEKTNNYGKNLFWQFDVRDGMEESVSGSRREKNARPTISSYMFGYANAIANLATMAGKPEVATEYKQNAATIKAAVQEHLWDDKDKFYKTRLENGELHRAREAIGYIPWYFNLPDDSPAYAQAWEQVRDSAGFASPWGLTTAERREPTFRTRGSGHGCEWDGAIWPFASTQTLKGLANLLNNYSNHTMTKQDYYDALHTYAWSHQKNGKPYLGEYQDEKTGYWLKGDNPRSSYYNHSGFTDLVINDLVGLKPQPGNSIEVQPLIPEGQWDWFCLDNVLYHNQIVTILWDKTGEKYGKGKGFRIFADGKEIHHSKDLKQAVAKLPSKKS
ncbi:MGH1-like glycoside hydrolase domain-containing protein [Pontibacter beigongshangensis]|uniref:MGH1-like glycoside hydrolase domain-containing protein n=1 Tax=Pontibacter beigongshangensis TaxID=2574733 RepID=UPI0016506656|nr:glycosyl hydrolase family 65 protein [Pontibacter beigongshangensis]